MGALSCLKFYSRHLYKLFFQVELLLMLDGSPKYVNNHCEYIKEEISEITASKSVSLLYTTDKITIL